MEETVSPQLRRRDFFPLYVMRAVITGTNQPRKPVYVSYKILFLLREYSAIGIGILSKENSTIEISILFFSFRRQSIL